MTDTSKPIVRLEIRSVARKAQKKAMPGPGEKTIKLAIRLASTKHCESLSAIEGTYRPWPWRRWTPLT